MNWWKRLWGKQEPPPMPDAEPSAIPPLRDSLDKLIKTERNLIKEMRRIENEIRRKGQAT